MSTLTRPDEDLYVREDVDVRDDDPSKLAHILHPRYTPAMLTQARVEGTPVEAWCGYLWVPMRDPKGLSICSRCKELHETYDRRPLTYS